MKKKVVSIEWTNIWAKPWDFHVLSISIHYSKLSLGIWRSTYHFVVNLSKGVTTSLFYVKSLPLEKEFGEKSRQRNAPFVQLLYPCQHVVCTILFIRFHCRHARGDCPRVCVGPKTTDLSTEREKFLGWNKRNWFVTLTLWHSRSSRWIIFLSTHGGDS